MRNKKIKITYKLMPENRGGLLSNLFFFYRSNAILNMLFATFQNANSEFNGSKILFAVFHRNDFRKTLNCHQFWRRNSAFFDYMYGRTQY